MLDTVLKTAESAVSVLEARSRDLVTEIGHAEFYAGISPREKPEMDAKIKKCEHKIKAIAVEVEKCKQIVDFIKERMA